MYDVLPEPMHRPYHTRTPPHRFSCSRRPWAWPVRVLASASIQLGHHHPHGHAIDEQVQRLGRVSPWIDCGVAHGDGRVLVPVPPSASTLALALLVLGLRTCFAGRVSVVVELDGQAVIRGRKEGEADEQENYLE